MAIKYTMQGLLIYLAIAAFLLAFGATVARRRKAGQTVFAAGFLVAVLSFLYRWYDVRHVPLQNLFEVFLFLGLVCYPISWFSRRYLRIGGLWADMLIGAVVLFPAGFVFHAEPMRLPPALQSWLFAPHVAVYMLAYIFMAKAAFQAGEQLWRGRPAPGSEGVPPLPLLRDAPAGCRPDARPRRPRHDAAGPAGAFTLPPEQATYELIVIGFPLLTLGLLLGSWWGKLAWGDYWGWDPKELWSLASWLVYLGYFHWRYLFGKKHPHGNSVWAIAGMLAIIITLLWVNLSRLFLGLHSYAT
jgi:ABC-type transport system involved in cytochrome c biogenesis permease subunit